MATGTVKWFSDEKGLGFITPDDPGTGPFVHHTGMAGGGLKSLAEGAKVSYDAENGPKGAQRGERSDALTPLIIAAPAGPARRLRVLPGGSAASPLGMATGLRVPYGPETPRKGDGACVE